MALGFVRLCRLVGVGLLVTLPLAACEDMVHAVKGSPVLRDIVEDGELTVYRREF